MTTEDRVKLTAQIVEAQAGAAELGRRIDRLWKSMLDTRSQCLEEAFPVVREARQACREITAGLETLAPPLEASEAEDGLFNARWGGPFPPAFVGTKGE